MVLGLFYDNYIACILGVSFILLCSLVLIIVQTNPVFAVFSFIITALLTFLFLVLLRAEFFALLVLIIYTGVITVLFLFVVIMYNLRQINLSWKTFFQNPFFFLSILKLSWIYNICLQGLTPILKQTIFLNIKFFTLDVVMLVELFNTHICLFLMCGLLIFIAMLGSIVITYPFYKAH